MWLVGVGVVSRRWVWLVGVGVSSGYGCKDVYTVFTLLIRVEKIKFFLTHRELL